MIAYQKASLRVAEFYFDEPAATSGADIARFHYRPQPLAGARCHVFHTLQVDLRRSADELLASMDKDARYAIRRAAREGFTAEFSSAPDGLWMTAFFDFYARFAASKGLPPANRERLMGMREHGALALSRAALQGDVQVWHCYLRTPSTARLIHSASLYRDVSGKAAAASIGRANSWLHFEDMLYFQAQGLTSYDFGGWYAGRDDAALLAINAFKESFGGRPVTQYNTDTGLTWKGSLALRARQLKDLVKGVK